MTNSPETRYQCPYRIKLLTEKYQCPISGNIAYTIIRLACNPEDANECAKRFSQRYLSSIPTAPGTMKIPEDPNHIGSATSPE